MKPGKKISKRGATGTAVIRKITVPPGTREIIVHVTIGRPAKKSFKSVKSGIDDDPGSG